MHTVFGRNIRNQHTANVAVCLENFRLGDQWMKMSEMEENGRNYVERNLDGSGATSVGRTPELDAVFTKDF